MKVDLDNECGEKLDGGRCPYPAVAWKMIKCYKGKELKHAVFLSYCQKHIKSLK